MGWHVCYFSFSHEVRGQLTCQLWGLDLSCQASVASTLTHRAIPLAPSIIFLILYLN